MKGDKLQGFGGLCALFRRHSLQTRRRRAAQLVADCLPLKCPAAVLPSSAIFLRPPCSALLPNLFGLANDGEKAALKSDFSAESA